MEPWKSKIKLPTRWQSRGLRGAWLFAVGFALILAVAGCSHSRLRDDLQVGGARVYTPWPPPFLEGPVAVLFTNLGGFSAHVAAQTNSLAEGQTTSLSGELLGRGSKLLFAPDRDEPTAKHAPPGGFSFIWDTATSSGYVLSEALQGYAPVSAPVRATNAVGQLTRTAAQNIGGYQVQTELVTIALNDGSTNSFEVSRAIALKGFPVRINSAAIGPPLNLLFSKIRFELPPEQLFAPPADFTKYNSPET